MRRFQTRSYPWVLYAAAGLLFAGAVLRSPLVIEDGAVLLVALLLLLLWLALLIADAFVPRRHGSWFYVYLSLQASITAGLLSLPGWNDFFAVLFGVMSMQALERLGPKRGLVPVVLFIPLTTIPLLLNYAPAQAATMTLIYTAINVFLGAYAVATRRATEARAENEALAGRLEAANADLREYSGRLERLAVARERNRLARELHDSVTQTIYSMSLTSQSAGLLLLRDPGKVDAQLERLAELARGALAEMRVVVSELKPDSLEDVDLLTAIRRDIERRGPAGLRISVEQADAAIAEPDEAAVHTDAHRRELTVQECQGLLRIAQEALNNIIKHSGASHARIRIGGRPPLALQIEDDGVGFDTGTMKDTGGMGLDSMRERAAEIGWHLQLVSAPAEGTKVTVTRGSWGEAADVEG